MTLIKPTKWRPNTGKHFPMSESADGTAAAKRVLEKRCNAIAYPRPEKPSSLMTVPFFSENGFQSALIAAERYLHGYRSTSQSGIVTFWVQVSDADDDKSNAFKLSIGIIGS